MRSNNLTYINHLQPSFYPSPQQQHHNPSLKTTRSPHHSTLINRPNASTAYGAVGTGSHAQHPQSDASAADTVVSSHANSTTRNQNHHLDFTHSALKLGGKE